MVPVTISDSCKLYCQRLMGSAQLVFPLKLFLFLIPAFITALSKWLICFSYGYAGVELAISVSEKDLLSKSSLSLQ
jgi:hypothetical protein